MNSEFCSEPRTLLVHDPAAAGALGRLSRVADRALLEREWLFREPPDEERYGAQHRAFVAALRRHIGDVRYLVDLVGEDAAYRESSLNPNQVFTRDSLITLPWAPFGYIAARLKEPSRRPETRTLEAAVRRLGLKEIVRLPETVFLEGGDVIPAVLDGRRTLLVGVGPRSSLSALEFLQGALIPQDADRIVGIELAPWRLNLDGGLLPVAEDVFVVNTESVLSSTCFDRNGRYTIDVLGMLRDAGMQAIETTREESIFAQSCNGVCLGKRRLIYYDLCPRVGERLRRAGIDTILVPGSELVKGRGGPRCMTRPIYAAAASPA